MEIKKTSKEWYELIPKKYKLSILDPDGWDRKNYEYSFNEELITIEEFRKRLSFSTVTCNRDFFDYDLNNLNLLFDWNTLSLDQMVNYLKEKFQFSSTGEAKCIFELIDFYEKHKEKK